MSSTEKPKRAINVFYSYAHEDEKLRNELEKHLRILKRQGQIISWHDRQIGAGKEWAREIENYISTAQIILLLVSPDFMDSDYCYSIEMKRAMERYERGEARVIPIILRPVYWQKAPFGKLQPLPANGKPVTRWQNRDEAFWDISLGILKIVEELTTKPIKTESNIKSTPRILIVDNDRYLVNMLKYWLESLGYEVLPAFNGEQAAKLYREKLPNLVILDSLVTQLNEFEAVRNMQNQVNNARAIMLVNSHNLHYLAEAIKIDVDDYIKKPFYPSDLLTRINTQLRRAY